MTKATKTTKEIVSTEIVYNLELSEEDACSLQDHLRGESRVLHGWVSRILNALESVEDTDEAKVGDRVRITKYRETRDGYRFAPVMEGQTGTINVIENVGDGLPYYVRLDTPTNDYGAIWVHSVEKI